LIILEHIITARAEVDRRKRFPAKTDLQRACGIENDLELTWGEVARQSIQHSPGMNLWPGTHGKFAFWRM
jgi:hypothetical protein